MRKHPGGLMMKGERWNKLTEEEKDAIKDEVNVVFVSCVTILTFAMIGCETGFPRCKVRG